MSPIAERLYQLLPAYHRARDLDQGEPLRALMGVLETELQLVRDDVDGLYDNWFIETCDPWVVSYIADLVGADALPAILPGTDGGRAYVGNSVGQRRRKGTAAALPTVVGPLSGWPSFAVEFFRLVGTTQAINHQAPQNLRTPSLRGVDTLRRIGTPFERVAHSIDLRRPGKASLSNVGAFVWRLRAYAVNGAPAAPSGTTNGFWFNVLGKDTPLFNPLRTLPRGVVASEATVPAPLVPAFVSETLDAARQAILANTPSPPNPYFDQQPAFQITIGTASTAQVVPPEQILITDLSAWPVPLGTTSSGSPIAAAVDPARGRLVLSAPPSGSVSVSYYHGFSSELGGGSYDRSATFGSTVAPVAVSGGDAASNDLIGAAFASHAGGALQVAVQIGDSLAYELRAANKQRPVLTQPLSIALGPGATLTLNGLLLNGNINVTASGAATLSLVHCTLVPGHSLSGGGPLTLTLSRCITGSLQLQSSATLQTSPALTTLVAVDSVIDGMAGSAVTAGSATFNGCTVFGSTTVGTLGAVVSAATGAAVPTVDTIFRDSVTITNTASGSVSTSFVPNGTVAPGSLVASLCQPALALDAVSPADRAAVRSRVQPSFTSTTYGDPGYAQLRRMCAPEILQGGTDQSEMGALHHLYQPLKQRDVQAGLAAYLRVGLGATVFFVT